MGTIPGKPTQLTAASQAVQFAYEALYGFHAGISARRYNLTISHHNRFVWFRVAKVGTRTVMRHLRHSDLVLDVQHPGFIRYMPKHYRDYFKFAFVRNPWDRLVSCWKDKVVGGNLFRFDNQEILRMQNFEQFVGFVESQDLNTADRHLRLQSALIDHENLDFLGRMENFEQDLGVVLERLGINGGRIGRRNASNDRRPYQRYYTAELAKRVGRIYAPDTDRFGYSFQS